MKDVIAIVGSRLYRDLEEPYDRARYLSARGHVIVSGGAKGVDTEAERGVLDDGKTPLVIRADWDAFGKLAGKLRNWDITNKSDRTEAYWDGMSPGTAHAIAARAARVGVLYDDDGKVVLIVHTSYAGMEL